MSIDWITVAAQAVNFLILVWLLKRFLYGPITRAIDEREARIAARAAAAAEAQAGAEQEQSDWRRKNQELEQQSAALLDQARARAETLHKELEAQARAANQQERERWRRQLAGEQTAFLTSMRDAASSAILTMAGKLVDDLADQTLEDGMARRFEVELSEKAPDLAEAIAKGDGAAVTVLSSFALSPARRKSIAKGLAAAGGRPIDVQFETDAERSAGLCLQVGGMQVDWGVESYLDQLEGDLKARVAAVKPLQTGTAQ